MSKTEFLDPLETEKFKKQKCVQFCRTPCTIEGLFCKGTIIFHFFQRMIGWKMSSQSAWMLPHVLENQKRSKHFRMSKKLNKFAWMQSEINWLDKCVLFVLFDSEQTNKKTRIISIDLETLVILWVEREFASIGSM